MSDYVGRFAPSPSGPLHFGSIVAALASYLDARHVRGKWLLRIEDLDPPRESKTAPEEITSQLLAFGFRWDDEIIYQSNRLAAYQTALTQLDRQQQTFRCTCSRKSLPDVYPGTCRNAHHGESSPNAIRFEVTDKITSIDDRALGLRSWNLAHDVGDFIIKRKDSLFAYQLAVVVDDDYQGVNAIVRGGDLLDSTPRQLSLYHALGRPIPSYLHIPVLTDNQGSKLSKQSHSAPVDTSNPSPILNAALLQLGQPIINETTSVTHLLDNAARNWQAELIPTHTFVNAPHEYQ